MTTTTRTTTLTQAQFDACSRVDHEDGTYHYEIASASEPGAFYTATFNKRYQRWQDNCKACREGVPCWHLRSVAAHEDIEADAARHEEIEALKREMRAVEHDGWKAYARQPLKLENGIPMR